LLHLPHTHVAFLKEERPFVPTNGFNAQQRHSVRRELGKFLSNRARASAAKALALPQNFSWTLVLMLLF